MSAAHAVEHVGMPECAFSLAQAAIYLSLAPKSNAAKRAIGAARERVREHGAPEPPDYLRSAAYPGARKLGRGQDYDYPHGSRAAVSEQELLPEEPRDALLRAGRAEAELAERLEEIRRKRGREP